MANFSGPYQIRIFYTTLGRAHVARLNCDTVGTPAIGETFDNITLVTKDTVGVAADVAVDALIDVIDGRFNTGEATFGRAELWKYEALSENADFVASYTIGATGNSANGCVPASELIMTFRTQEGGIMKFVLEETSAAAGAAQDYPPNDSGDQDIMDYITADDTWVLAKDTSYPVVPLRFLPGQNERAFKKLYRD